jgi:hypothetical protein
MYIEPMEILGFDLFDLHKAPDLFRLGYEKTRQLLSAPAPVNTLKAG